MRKGSAPQAPPSANQSGPSEQSGQSEQSGWVLGDRYRVVGRLGSGGMADVLRAHDELLNRDVAVKVFRTAVDADGETNGPARRELELQSLAQLSHPNLVTLFDGSVAESDPAYLVLELVDGPNLASRLAEDGPLSLPMARQVGAQIAGALAYVHAHDLVHRDVKPANILLGSDGRARLSDFGIVRMVGSARMTAADLTIGTASYIAPEQARGEPVGPPADVYSLGLVLIESFTGVRSYDGPIQEVLISRLTRGPDIPPNLPEPWPGLLAAMTANDPAARPTAQEVAETLATGTATGLATPPVIPVASRTVPVAGAPSTNFLPAGAAVLPTGATIAGPPLLPTGPSAGRLATDPGPRRSVTGIWLLAAAVFLGIVLAGGYFLLRSGPGNTPTNLSPSTNAGASHRAAGKSATHSTQGQSVAADTRTTAHPGQPKSTAHRASGPAKQSSPANQPPAGGAPTHTHSAAPSGGQPSTSTPPPSTSPPASAPGSGNNGGPSAPPSTPISP